LNKSLLDRLDRADVVLFDGTLFDDNEMIRGGTGTKTGRRMGHLPLSGADGTLQTLARLSARRILTHINNTNPILVDGSRERHEVEAAGFEIAVDGMEIVI
jgi:pyrroloquinoline quinone biosynthesis protein B